MNQTQIRDNDAAAQIQEVNYEFLRKLQQTLGKSIKDAANEEIYAALLSTVKEAAADKGRNISEIGRKYIIYQQNS